MSSTTSTPELEAPADKEKQDLASPNHASEYLVKWDNVHDALNPQNLRAAYKWIIVTVVSVGSLLV